MNYSCINFSLDIHSPVSQVSLAVKKGETNKKLRISLIENGKPFKLTEDCAVVFSGIKSDGTILYNECIIKNNVIEYILTEQTTKIEGIVACEILVYGGDSQVLYTPSFSLVVYSPAYDIDDVLTSTNEYTALISAMSRLETAIDEAEEALAVAKKLMPRKIYVTLLASAWSETDKDGVYTQKIEVKNATENTQIEFNLSDEQIQKFANEGYSFNVINELGTITVSVFGERPIEDYSLQATATEVFFEEAEEEVINDV